MDPTERPPIRFVEEPSTTDRLKRFGRKIRAYLPGGELFDKQPAVSNRNRPEVSSTPEAIPNHNLQELLDQALAEKGLKPPFYESKGSSEFLYTNEKYDPTQFEAIRNSPDHPNGYIFGVGTSSLFTCLELFTSENPPKGVVMVNIDPMAIEDATKFVARLKQDQIQHDEAGKVTETSVRQAAKIEPVLVDGILDVDWAKYKNAELLAQLAKEGKIAIIQQDLFSPDVLDTLSDSLPDLKTSKNVVYLSNVGDWIRRSWKKQNQGIVNSGIPLSTESRAILDSELRKQYGIFNNFQHLSPESPNFNYFVDTSELEHTGIKQYQQSVSKQLPDASRYMF